MRTWCVLLSGLISLQWIIPTSSKVEQWTGGYTHPMFNYTCKFNVGKDVYNLEALERKSPPDYFMDTDDGKRVYVNFCTHLIKNCNGSEGDHNGIVQVWNKWEGICLGRLGIGNATVTKGWYESRSLDIKYNNAAEYCKGGSVTIKLKCNPLYSKAVFNKIIPGEDNCNYVLEFFSKKVCDIGTSSSSSNSSSTSIWTWILIILLILIIYHIIGAFINKRVYGYESYNAAIPHRIYWEKIGFWMKEKYDLMAAKFTPDPVSAQDEEE